MCPANIGLVKALFDGAIHYLGTLRFPSGELLINSRQKTEFIGLIINMKSALALYKHLVEDTKILKYHYKISQDHVELFFSAIRTRGGFNNNPNAMQFRAAYKKLLIRTELREGGVGNCVSLKQINILTCSSKNPVETINDLTEKQSLVEIDEDHSDLYDNFMLITLGPTSANIVRALWNRYMAGFVSRKLCRSIKIMR